MLDNSMENAFAGLLRSKAPLDVSKTEADPSNLERSMTNAPALAGFSKGKSAQDILSDMKNEIQSLNNAKPLIDNQKKLAYQLARQQYQLAKKAYASSDSIAKSINDKVESAKAKGTPYIFNDQDKAALEKSLELRKAADQMRIKADAALLLGDQYTAYQASIDPTLKELYAQSSKLQAYI
jgi:dihydroxyacetone kinase DhaKLM complex PTS-EIIA-like component DhaM